MPAAGSDETHHDGQEGDQERVRQLSRSFHGSDSPSSDGTLKR
jgi:hypothetical protein